MKAIVYSEYGSPDVLRLAEIEKPAPKENQVLVKVRAASVNPLDWRFLRGQPRIVRIAGKPKNRIPGGDLAGQVEAVGARITQFRPGDEVFGTCNGTFAEYACVKENRIMRKPPALPFEQAAAIPVAMFTAVQALRDKGRLQPGQSVLIVGAAGGVGTFTVQVAKALGGIVTGVCSTRNVELVRSIGADHVIDYTRGDYTLSEERYDLVLQVAGNRKMPELRRLVAAGGTFVAIGGGVGRDESGTDGMLEVLGLLIGGNLLSRFRRQRAFMLLAHARPSDLVFATELIAAGKLKPVIDRTYPLAEAAEAIRYLEAGHARGKVIVVV
jgi:NADPH:quinone reductase-like Zn-dependent oxidoreductase